MSRYQPRHAASVPSRRPVRTVIAVTGLTTALGVPLLASPAAAATAGPVTVVSGSPATVRTGSRGAGVVQVQSLLHVATTGIFDGGTRSAVVSYQRSHALAPDGIVGPRTWAALRGAPVSATAPAPAAAPAAAPAGSKGTQVVAEAARHRGKPYRFGAQGPGSFDCSGFTSYVYGQVGVQLPRTAAAQHSAARSVAKSDARPGDLIFMTSGGRVSHVGIYAGNNTMWVARHTGTTVTQQTIWTSNYLVGRAV